MPNSEITLPLFCNAITRRLVGRSGGSPELPPLVAGDQLVCKLSLFESRDGDLRKVDPHVRSLRASLGFVGKPPERGTFTLNSVDEATGEVSIGPPILFNATAAQMIDALNGIGFTGGTAGLELAAQGNWVWTCPNDLPRITVPDSAAANSLFPSSFIRIRQNHVPYVEIQASLIGDNEATNFDIEADGIEIGMLVESATVEEGEIAPGTVVVAVASAGAPGVFTVTLSHTKLVSETIAVIFHSPNPVFTEREIRLIQAPIAFTGDHERIVPPAPTVRRVRTGSTEGTEDSPINEVQAISIPPDFEGTFVLTVAGKQSALLGQITEPEQIAEALNALWSDGETRFVASNPEAENVYVEFAGPFANAPQDLIAVTVKSAPPGVLTFPLNLHTAGVYAALRTVPEIKVTLEVELEIVESAEALETPEVPGKIVTVFQQEFTLRREQITPELAAAPNINWLRPPGKISYVPFTPDQVITGNQHWIGVRGDGADMEFAIDHDLNTEAISSIAIRENFSGGRVLFPGVDFTATVESANEIAITIIGAAPAVNGIAIIITTAGPRSAFQAHTHTIPQIVGLEDAFAELGERVAVLEEMKPSLSLAVRETEKPAATEFKIPNRTFIFPGRLPADVSIADLAAGKTDKLPRPPGMLPAIHDALAAQLTIPLPSAAATEGQVFVNNTGSEVLIPGGLGRRGVKLQPSEFCGSDGRVIYKLTRNGATNSYFPADFEREFFALPINSKQLRAGKILPITFNIALALLKATCKAQIGIVIEVGSVPSQAAPSPTAPNLEDVVWNPTPLLSQRIIVSDLSIDHTFGVAIKRSAAGVITADQLIYEGWEAAAVVPGSADFVIRARMVNFDTENSATHERGFVFAEFKNAKAAIQ